MRKLGLLEVVVVELYESESVGAGQVLDEAGGGGEINRCTCYVCSYKQRSFFHTHRMDDKVLSLT